MRENPHKGGPPLGEEGEGPDMPRLCSRFVGPGDRLCGAPAIRHIIYWWEPNPPPDDGFGYDHGFVCAEHWEEFQRLWTCPSSHGIGTACGMPGSVLYFNGEESWCEFEDLPVAEPIRTIAVAEESLLHAVA